MEAKDTILKAFFEEIQGEAKFLELGKDKKPLRRYASLTAPGRLQVPPDKGNYGIIPVSKLLILDLDTKAPLELQTEFFSKVFGTDLRQTLSVATPSGGIHYYLFAPEIIERGAISLPKGSLRGKWAKKLSREYGEECEIDADLRSPQQSGYVVGPGSSINSKEYLVNLAPIAEISPEAFEKLRRISEEHYMTVREREAIRVEKAVEKEEDTPLSSSELFPGWVYESLQKSLDKRETASYHEKRAVVKALLGCCWDDKTIMHVYKELKINRDSFTTRSISDSAILRDLERLSKRRYYHGGAYCQHKQALLSSKKGEVNADRTDGWKFEDRGRPISKRLYRVLDMSKIAQALYKKSRPDSQVVTNAYAIVEHFLQPLSNYGARKIVLAQKELQRYFEWSPSQCREALRLLRESEVVVIALKPFPGRSTLYEIPERWNDSSLSKVLAKTRRSHVIYPGSLLHPTVEFVFREGSFVDALTRQILFKVNKLPSTEVPLEIDKDSLGSIAVAYLVNEVEARVSSDGEFVPSVKWSCSILKTLDDEVFQGGTIQDFLPPSEINDSTATYKDEEGNDLSMYEPLFDI